MDVFIQIAYVIYTYVSMWVYKSMLNFEKGKCFQVSIFEINGQFSSNLKYSKK